MAAAYECFSLTRPPVAGKIISIISSCTRLIYKLIISYIM